MASGNQLAVFLPQENEPPSSIPATFDTRNQHPLYDFDASTDEEAVFTDIIPGSYDGGGVTVDVGIAMSSASTGNVVIQGAFEKFDDEVQVIDSDGFAAFQSSLAIAVPGTLGDVKRVTITFTDGGQMDSVGAGDAYRFKIRRDADDTSATDSAAGDMELRFVEIKET